MARRDLEGVERERVAHYHQCTECHEYEACTMACSIPVLGEYKGCPMGSHATCFTCVDSACEERLREDIQARLRSR